MGGRGGANLSANRDVAGGGGGARADEGVAALAALLDLEGGLTGVDEVGVRLEGTGGVLSEFFLGTFFNGVDAAFRGSEVAWAFAGNLAGTDFLAGNLALTVVLGF